jgi:hypothetical protein
MHAGASWGGLAPAREGLQHLGNWIQGARGANHGGPWDGISLATGWPSQRSLLAVAGTVGCITVSAKMRAIAIKRALTGEDSRDESLPAKRVEFCGPKMVRCF